MSPKDPMDRLIAAIAKHTRALQAQTKAVNRLVQINQDLIQLLLSEDEEAEEAGHGVDMAGNPIRAS